MGRSKKLVVIAALSVSATALAAPTPDAQWNNFVGVSTLWTTGANWIPAAAPTSSIDRVLGFGSSSLQTGGGYTTTFSNAGAAFDLNSIVFNGFGASNPSLVVTGNAAGDTLRFNTSSTSVLPSIWQVGTGRVIIQNGSATNGITLNNGTTLEILGDGIGELQLNANIVQAGTGSSGIKINQTGTRSFATGALVRLGGTNTFAGGVNLTAGNLVIGSASALGTGTFTVNGGTFQIDPATTSGFTISNAISLNSTLNITGNNNTSATNPTAHATFSGPISGSGGISIVNNGSNLSGGGFATMAYSLTGANSFTGAVTVAPFGNAATILSVSGAGTIAGTTSLNASYAGTIRLDNTSTVATRLNTVTAPTVNLGGGGSLQMLGNSAASAAETFGTLNVSGGAVLTVLGTSASAQTTTTTFGGLTQSNKGTLFIIGTNLGSGTGAGESIVKFNTNPGGATGGGGAIGTPTVNILPYAVANAAGSTTTITANVSSGLVRWDSASGRIVPLSSSEYATSSLALPGLSGSLNNQRLQSSSVSPSAFGAAGINQATSINSLVLDTNTAAPNRVGVSVSGSGTLTVAGGAIFATINGSTSGASNPSMINTGGLAFGSATGYVHTFGNLTINSPITGSTGLVKAAGGTLLLTGNNSFTGGLNVNAGQVQFNTDANLGASGGTVTLQSGSGSGLRYIGSNLFTTSTTNALTLTRPININSSGGSITVDLLNNALTLNGNLSGSGVLYKAGSGALKLTGNNSTYTGTIVTFGGVVTADSDAALGGSGATINLTNGYLQPSASFATSKDILVNGLSAFIHTGGQNLTLNGNVSSQNASATLFKLGSGDLIVNSTIAHLGQFQLGASNPTSSIIATTGAGVQTSGRVILQGANGAMPLASSVFSIGGGELILDNTATANSNRIGSVTVSTVGGDFTLKGNASTSINEAIGAISFSNGNNPYGGVISLSTPNGSGQSTTLTALSISANSAGGTVLVRGTNLGAASGDRTALVLGTSPTAVNSIVPSLVTSTSATGEASDFAALSTITVASPNANQFAVVPFSAYTAGTGALGAGAATNTYNITGAASFTGAGLANALKMNGGSSVSVGTTLTLGAAHVLSVGGSPSSISGGTLAFGTSPARFTVTNGSDLTVSSATTGSAGLIKTGAGTLTLNTASTIGVTAGTSFFGIGAGTLKYGVANALPTTPNIFVNAGATLDINGTTSTVGNINGFGNVNIGAGSLTVGSIAQIVAFGGALSGSGTLIKSTSSITTALAGDSTAGFTGGVQIQAGTLSLLTSGALGTGTSAIQLGNTSGSSVSTLALGAALTSFSRDITVPAGATNTFPHTLSTSASVLAISSNIVINASSVSVASGGIALNTVGLQLNGTSGSAGGNITSSGTISGPGGIYMFSGNWSFSGNNTFSGGFFADTATTGSLGIGSDSIGSTSGPLGTGPVCFSTSFGSNLRADGGARTLNNEIRISSTGGYFGVAGTNPLTLAGPVDFQGATTAQTLNILNTANTTISGVIRNGTGGFNKNGPGRLTLANGNTYTGNTNVNAGTLIAANTTGSATGTGSVIVNSGAVLGGNGIITGPVTINAGGVLSPGSSAGLLSTGNVTLSNGTAGNGSVVLMEMDGTSRGVVGGFDAVASSGSFAYDGTLALAFSAAFPTGSYDLFDFSSQSGNFDEVTLTGVYGSGTLTQNLGVGFSGTVGGASFVFTNIDGVLSITSAAVPEPLVAASVLLLAGRMLGRRSRVSM